MKYSYAVAAAFAVLCGVGSAQSTVVIYGKIDLGVGKQIGSGTTQVFDTGNTRTSRLGFRGVEDLGGGYAALFGLEQRFNPDEGSSTSTSATVVAGASEIKAGYDAQKIGDRGTTVQKYSTASATTTGFRNAPRFMSTWRETTKPRPPSRVSTQGFSTPSDDAAWSTTRA